MKRLVLLTASMLIAFSASAERITEQEAQGLASRFFEINLKGKAARQKSDLKLARVGRMEMPASPVAYSADPTYYVFNREQGGFVVIAADDCVDPLLGYSYEGSFPTENVPDNLAYWLDHVLSGELSYARATGAKYEHKAEREPVKAGATVLQLVTANWNQGAPYNGESPVIDGHKCITGCVATAAAIKCRYHEWPYRGSGVVPSYSYDSDDAGRAVRIDENKLGRVYDYSNMPLNYDGSATAEQKAAVAALMYDLGCGCFMMFGWNGSGAYSDYMADAFSKYFHYTEVKYVSKSGDETAWAERLEAEMQANGPVMYDGYASGGGGHQFLFDGYTDDHFFRVNWGWGGSGNGFFRTSSLGNSSTGVYSEGQAAMFNCGPDRNGIYTPDEIASMTSLKYTNNMLSISNEMKFDLVFSKDGKEVKSLLNNADGAKVVVSVSELGGAGKYTLLVRLSDFYKEFPDSQYSFELQF